MRPSVLLFQANPNPPAQRPSEKPGKHRKQDEAPETSVTTVTSSNEAAAKRSLIAGLTTMLSSASASVSTIPVVSEYLGAAAPYTTGASVVTAGAASIIATLSGWSWLRAARAARLPPETRAFKPHITLARMKNSKPEMVILTVLAAGAW